MSTPQLDVQPGTPAREWANDTILTTSAVNPDPYSTPNLEIPGAYPLTKDDQDPNAQADPTKLVDRAKDYLPSQDDVVGRAKQYLPAQENVDQALINAGELASATLQSAADTARQYLPNGVATYLPGVGASGGVSLPSTEVNGARPSEHVDGVGALPGRVNEAGVAKLLDERAPEEKQSTLAGVAVTAGEKAAAAQRSFSQTFVGVQESVKSVKDAAGERAQETVKEVNGTT
ncbi:hypothetical protein OE88DRAFT_1657760 [Heliocybe sulcata]|uniref:Uncharacterized protein n=1 Tax=Heliocybe sulcata TaxID=5364 RepID=A0A5C3N5B3_9AGAM|nr:hypothetical protein OE88DRAFT_1657760 [Heliocybe sulcata]